MRFYLILFGVFFLRAVHAVTMCVPDLSQMTGKCEPIGYTKNTWTVNCNGVEVSGVLVGFVANYSGGVYKVPELPLDGIDNLMGRGGYACLMTSPMMATYLMPVMEYGCYNINMFPADASICMNSFRIQCAFSACNVGEVCVDMGGA